MKLWKVLMAAAAVLALVPAAKAESFTFMIDGTNFQSDLTFTASQIAGQPAGVDVITAVSGWFSDPDSGLVNLAVTPAAIVSAGGALAPNYADNGLFLFDNVLYTTATGNGILDWGGVLLQVGSYELNIFSDAYGADDLGQTTDNGYFYWADSGSYHYDDPIPTPDGPPAPGVLFTPEPSSLLMLGSGLALLALGLLRAGRRHDAQGAAA